MVTRPADLTGGLVLEITKRCLKAVVRIAWVEDRQATAYRHAAAVCRDQDAE